MDSLFEFQSVTKRYKDVTALDDISLSIHQGEVLGYIGPNGAGKTTTLKILVGLIQNFHGRVLYKGESTSSIEVFNALRQDLGFVPQETGFQKWRTVKHALQTFGLLSGVPRDILNDRINRSLELVGLNDVIDKKITHLSGGMKQKLKFAQAILHQPKFLVLDEPMSGLDPSSRFHVKNIIKNLHVNGITIFLSSHILNDIENLATRIAIINQGKIMKIGSPEELREEFRIGNNVKVTYLNTSIQLQKNDLECIDTITQEAPSIQIIHSIPEIGTEEFLHSIMQHFVERRTHIKSIQLEEPNLEDVYLHYVGGRQLL